MFPILLDSDSYTCIQVYHMKRICGCQAASLPSSSGMGVGGEPYAMGLVQQPSPDLPSAPGASELTRRQTGGHSFRCASQAASAAFDCSGRLPLSPPDALGEIIGAQQSSYFIKEEEVPRAGRIVVRSFERTRWLDGRVVLWLGRRTMTGRGEGSSGLAFDTLEEIPSRD